MRWAVAVGRRQGLTKTGRTQHRQDARRRDRPAFQRMTKGRAKAKLVPLRPPIFSRSSPTASHVWLLMFGPHGTSLSVSFRHRAVIGASTHLVALGSLSSLTTDRTTDKQRRRTQHTHGQGRGARFTCWRKTISKLGGERSSRRQRQRRTPGAGCRVVS